MDMHLIYEKSSSTHDLNRNSWATPQAVVLLFIALLFAVLLLGLPGRAQAAAGETAGAEISAFTPGPGSIPLSTQLASAEEPAETEPATAVTQTSATLNATVNPAGAEVTECQFEYGTSTTPYATSVPCAQSLGSLDAALNPVPVSVAVSGLTANTTYHFRISEATMSAGVKVANKGADVTFKTLPNPPVVVTGAASSLGTTSATLNATVNPNGGEVMKCEFEYGTTTSYGSKAPCSPAPGSGSSTVAVTGSATGLKAGTSYHFRISATNPGGTSPGSDATFKTTNPPTVVTEAASPITKSSVTLNGSVNPNGETITACKFEWEVGGASTYPAGKSVACTQSPISGSSPVKVSASITTPLTPNIEYHFRIVATSAGGTGTGTKELFKTLPEPPVVVTGTASEETPSTATLNATVNPNGAVLSACEFEYGTTTSYGSHAPCSTLPAPGNSAVPVSAHLTGLMPDTTYHFRISATNAGGTKTDADATFTTLQGPPPPVVVTGAAASVAQTTATLNATVNPNGAEVTSCEFEYGTTTSYGSTASCSPAPGSGTSAVSVSASLSGLTPNTAYHFRISATTAGGTGTGADEELMTTAEPAPPPPPPTGSTGPVITPPTTGLPAPALTKTANVARAAGQVLLRLPGTRAFVTLSSPRQIPYGTVIEATHGEVSITAATTGTGTQKGEFFDGEFVVSQGTDGRVLATLSGGNFGVCPPTAKAARKAHAKYAASTHLVRRLWAEARGDFSTKGRYAGGIVKGAQWLTEDMCQGTLILATRERLEVSDLVRHRHLELVTGGIYIAKPK